MMQRLLSPDPFRSEPVSLSQTPLSSPSYLPPSVFVSSKRVVDRLSRAELGVELALSLTILMLSETVVHGTSFNSPQHSRVYRPITSGPPEGGDNTKNRAAPHSPSCLA